MSYGAVSGAWVRRFGAILPVCLPIVLGWWPLAAAGERPTMADTSTESDVRDCVRRAARAVSEEQLTTYLDCFTVKQRARIRRQAALLFVAHSLDLELVDSHLLSDEGSTAELAVNYTVTCTDQSFTIISVLMLASEGGAWRIADEKVLATVPLGVKERADAPGPVFRFGGGCANGRCGL